MLPKDMAMSRFFDLRLLIGEQLLPVLQVLANTDHVQAKEGSFQDLSSVVTQVTLKAKLQLKLHRLTLNLLTSLSLGSVPYLLTHLAQPSAEPRHTGHSVFYSFLEQLTVRNQVPNKGSINSEIL